MSKNSNTMKKMMKSTRIESRKKIMNKNTNNKRRNKIKLITKFDHKVGRKVP
jgi:hypothetical protein